MTRFCAVLALIVLNGMLRAGESAPQPLAVAPLPAAKWTMLAAPGDEVSLSETDGVLVAKFKLNINKTFLVGHVTYWRG